VKRRNAGPPPPDGLVIVDKPAGLTSHDVVGRLRRIAGTRRVGHAGTLDPMATGVLVIGIEKATRLLGHLALTEKQYDGTIRLGQATVTDDAEGEVTDTTPAGHVSDERITAGIAELTGPIMLDGKRSYSRVRDGEEFELAARPTTISVFDVLAIRREGDLIDIDVSVTCSSGTYIRALARDLGAGLGVGGHLTALRRTRVGPYTLDQARTLEQLEESFKVLPIAQAAAAAFPRREVTEDQARAVSHGGRLPADESDGPVGVFGPDGTFLALVENKQGVARPLAVFVG
jgi:tRNA pseudouridine55 synthase